MGEPPGSGPLEGVAAGREGSPPLTAAHDPVPAPSPDAATLLRRRLLHTGYA